MLRSKNLKDALKILCRDLKNLGALYKFYAALGRALKIKTDFQKFTFKFQESPRDSISGRGAQN